MTDEISLYNKLNTLQAEMLKFHKEMSPVKVQEADRMLLPEDEDKKFLSTCMSIAFSFLKILVCMVGPTLFPAIIYCIEGSSQLFWQVTAVSCIITLLLAMLTVTILCIHAREVQSRVKEMFITLNKVLNNIGLFRYLWEVLISDFMKMNIHKVLHPVAMLFISGLVSYITYIRKLWIIFYASLISIGFILGILTSVISSLLASPELLPFHSPCKIKMAVTTPSPKAKRDLGFKSHKEQSLATESQLSTPNTMLLKENSQFIGTENIAAALPNYAPSINHEEMGNTSIYQLPINFSNFFRRFQSENKLYLPTH